MYSYQDGMPSGTAFPPAPSRSSEFYSGGVGGGSVHTVQSNAIGEFRPTSVITPVIGNPNGQSRDTFDRQRLLNTYRY